MGSPYLNLLPCQIRRGKQQLVDAGAVWRGEDDFVGRTFLLGQDHLPAGGVVSVGQDVLLLSRGGRLQRRHNLDLLARLLIRDDLLYATMKSHSVKECELCRRLRPGGKQPTLTVRIFQMVRILRRGSRYLPPPGHAALHARVCCWTARPRRAERTSTAV